MRVFDVIKRVIVVFENTRDENKVMFWLVFALGVVLYLGYFITIIKTLKDIKMKKMGFLPKMMIVINNFLLVTGIIILFPFLFYSSEADVPIVDMLDTRFFIEILIIAIVFVIVKLISMYWQEEYYKELPIEKNSDDDDAWEQANSILAYIVHIILTIIFVFTSFENSISNFGFSIFGKKIGTWLFDGYTGWSVAIIIKLIMEILNIVSYKVVIYSVKKMKSQYK